MSCTCRHTSTEDSLSWEDCYCDLEIRCSQHAVSLWIDTCPHQESVDNSHGTTETASINLLTNMPIAWKLKRLEKMIWNSYPMHSLSTVQMPKGHGIWSWYDGISRICEPFYEELVRKLRSRTSKSPAQKVNNSFRPFVNRSSYMILSHLQVIPSWIYKLIYV